MPKHKPIRITIYVRGGAMQDVLADRPGVTAMLVDYDNEDAGESKDSREFLPVAVNKAYIKATIAGNED
jgi:hypothetical protein